ncbi:MAG: hypothetical protein KDF67_17125 [Ottowia sp.]|nr:hypothetical protein [Ottowia sp.]
MGRSDRVPADKPGRRLPGPLRLQVNNRRHSSCAMPLGWLDWSRWFTDGAGGQLYLHVYGPDGAIVRVYCRRSDKPRLEFMDGQLWWLVDRAAVQPVQPPCAATSAAACTAQTVVSAGFFGAVQPVQALSAGAHTHGRVCERAQAGAPAQGRAPARARVHAPAQRKKTKGGNHLGQCGGCTAAAAHSSTCRRCLHAG